MLQNLKIHPILGDICKSVKNNLVTIVSTPTGSGKTLAVPVTLEYCLNKRVFVTVPRVLLAKQAALNVIKLVLGENFSHKVGTMTGKFNQNTDANLVFCTERSFLNRVKLHSDDILVIDEIHEQGINTEEVIFSAKQHIALGGRVVLMSATMDCSKYQMYFGEEVTNIIELPETERQYSTTVIESDPYNCLPKVVELGGISLIGVAGKGDIEMVSQKLRQLGYNNPIFPLHSEIEEDEEEKLLLTIRNNRDCIIVATAVAMSGITLENLSNVVVPIYGKRIEDGKLCDYILSEAEAKQWAGRVGRISNGTVIKIDNGITRDKNPLPEILRIDVIDVVLSFLGRSIDLRTIKLLNQPSLEKVNNCFSILEKSAIILNNALTEKGQFISKLGEGLVTGSLLYEGKKLGIPAYAMKIAAVISNGNPFRKMSYRYSKINKEIAKKSEHYTVVETIENDPMLHFSTNADISNFAKSNNIFLKGVNMLRKSFNRIDREYKDTVEITLPIIQQLFSLQLVTNIYSYGCNDYNRVVSNMCEEKMYCTLTPVILKRGMLAELTTVLS